MFLKSVLLLLCLGISLTVADQCSQGPGYWCASFKNAETCHATKHCSTTVWKNDVFTKDSSENCVFCQSIINDMSVYVDMNNEEESRKFMTLSCQLLLKQNQANECYKKINTFYGNIVDMINNKVAGKTICSLLEICSSDMVAKETRTEVKEAVTGDVLCDDCVKMMTDFKEEWFTQQKADKVVELIDKNICSALSIVRTECKSVASEIVNNFFTNLKSKFNPKQICFAFCPQKIIVAEQETMAKLFNQVVPILGKLQSNSESDLHHLCKMVLGDISQLIKDDAFKHFLKNFARNDVCVHMEKYAEKCTEMVDLYLDLALDFLEKELDAQSFCDTYFPNHLSQQPSKSESLKWIPLAQAKVFESQASNDERPINQASNNENLNNQALNDEKYNNPAFTFLEKQPPLTNDNPAFSYDLVSKKEDKLPTATIGNPICTLCRYLMDEIKHAIGTNVTENRVVVVLENICKIVPKDNQKACDDFIEKYGKEVVSFLVEGLTSELICDAIGLCAKEKAKIKDDTKCEVCEIVLEHLESMLDNNETINQIEFLVSKVCKLLPKHQKNQCLNIVDEFGPLIVHYIATHAPPKQVCMLLHLCSAQLKKSHKECIAGPSFWCASQENAQFCQAEEHCKKFVWMQ